MWWFCHCANLNTGYGHKRGKCSEPKKELINSAEKSEREREREREKGVGLINKLKGAAEGSREN